MKKLFLAFAAVLTCFGCYDEDVRYDLYLHPDNSVEWMTIQFDIRSDASDPSKRREENEQMTRAAGQGTNGAALALKAIGGHDVQTRILGGRVPHAAITTARFDSIEDIFEDLLQEIGLRHNVTLEHGVMLEGAQCKRLTIQVWDEEIPDDEESPAERIAFQAEQIRINLVEGRFVAASGFDISKHSQASLIDQEGSTEDGSEMLNLWLAWTLERRPIASPASAPDANRQ